MKSLSRIFAILLKEVRQLRRDRLTFGMVVGLPVLQMLLFGYAINTDVRNLKTAIADQANTHLSREFVAALSQTQVVDIIGGVDSPRQLETLLRDGSISIGVHIPHDFDRRIVDRTRAASHLLVDGSDPTSLKVSARGEAGERLRLLVVSPPPDARVLVVDATLPSTISRTGGVAVCRVAAHGTVHCTSA